MDKKSEQVEQKEIEGQVHRAVPKVVLDVVALIFKRIEALMVSRPEEFHPRPLAKRCRNLSIHTASIKQTLLPSPFSSG